MVQKLIRAIGKAAARPYQYGIVVDVGLDRCSVQFTPNSRLGMIRYIGPKPTVGIRVKVEWESGEPIVKMSGESTAYIAAATGGGMAAATGTRTDSTVPANVALLDDDNVFVAQPQHIEVASGSDATWVLASGSGTGSGSQLVDYDMENAGVEGYGNVAVLDGQCAKCIGLADGTPSASLYQRFVVDALPEGFVPVGVIVHIAAQINGNASAYSKDYLVQFCDSGSNPISDNKASLSPWAMAPAWETRSYGGPADNWGISGSDFTAAMFSSGSNFALRYIAYRDPPGALSCEVDVDYINIVFYNEAGVTYATGVDYSRRTWAVQSGSALSGSGLEFDGETGTLTIPATYPEEPLSVSSSALNANLNADLLDGLHRLEMKLDDWAPPDDNTDLDATTGSHGLLPKLSGSATDALLGDGTWGPNGGGGGHVIEDVSGSFVARANLKFTGAATVTDDSINDATVVDISGSPGTTTHAVVGTEIASVVLGAGGSAALDIQNIPAGYDYLELFLEGRTDEAVLASDILLTFNGDTTDANYYVTHFTWAEGDFKKVYVGAGRWGSKCPGDSASAGIFGSSRTIIQGYDGVHGKIAHSTYVNMASLSSGSSGVEDLMWYNDDAITQITLAPYTGGKKFLENTKLVLVGYKDTVLFIGGSVSGSGTADMLTKWTSASTLGDSGIYAFGSGSLTLGGYGLDVPATGSAALLGIANTFTEKQTISLSVDNTKLVLNTGVDASGYGAQIDFGYAGSMVNAFGFWRLGTTKLFSLYDVSGRNPWLMIPGTGQMAINPPAYTIPSQLYLNVEYPNIGFQIDHVSYSTTHDIIAAFHADLTPAVKVFSVSGAGEMNSTGAVITGDARITSKLGIGTVPSYPLHVIGEARIDGDLAASQIIIEASDAGTNTYPIEIALRHNTSGTPTTAFGSSMSFSAQTSGVGAAENQSQAQIIGTWLVADHATRQGGIWLWAYDYGGARTVMIGEGSGTAPKVAFLGAAPVVRAAHIADATDLATALTRIAAINVVLENLGFVATA